MNEIYLRYLSSFSSDSSCQLDISWHNGYSFCMNGAQVGILHETNKIGFRCFLKCHDSTGLKSQISFVILSNLTNQTLERQLSQQQFSGLLVSSDFSQGYSSWSISMGFLYSSSGRG